jgi:hypothetical protein
LEVGIDEFSRDICDQTPDAFLLKVREGLLQFFQDRHGMSESILARHIFGAFEEKLLSQDLQTWRLRIIDKQEVQVLEGFSKILLVHEFFGAGQDHLFIEPYFADIFPEDFVAPCRKQQDGDLEFVGFFDVGWNSAVGEFDRCDFDAPARGLGLEGYDVKRYIVHERSDEFDLFEDFFQVGLCPDCAGRAEGQYDCGGQGTHERLDRSCFHRYDSHRFASVLAELLPSVFSSGSETRSRVPSSPGTRSPLGVITGVPLMGSPAVVLAMSFPSVAETRINSPVVLASRMSDSSKIGLPIKTV